MKNSRIQMRSVCCVCGKTQAVNGNLIVPHGYSLNWGFRNGVCSGAHQVHYGHKDAIPFLKSKIEKLKEEEISLPETIKKLTNPEDKKYKRQAEEFLKRIPVIIKALEDKIENWEEYAPIEVDIEIEAQELKKIRKAEAEKKKAAKAAKEAEKEAKKAEREAKHKLKWTEILSNNYHSVELDGKVIAEWTAAFESRNQLENEHYAATRKWLDENGIDDHYERMGIIHRIIRRVRKETSTGKQLHKF